MPTQQWFEENPKVSAYIPKDLHQALESWMKEKHIKKVSQAITKILEIQLGFSGEETAIKPGMYATVEQLNELRDELKALLAKKTSAAKTTKKAPARIKAKDIVQGSLDVEHSYSSEEWLTAKEAHQVYGGNVSYDSFRKSSVEKLREKFGLEADLSKKKTGRQPGKWLKKI